MTLSMLSAVVGKKVWVFPNSLITNKIVVGNKAQIGAGSIVLDNVKANETVVSFTLDSGTGNVYVDKVNVMSNNTDFRSNYGQVTGTTGIGIADGPDGGYRGEMKGYIPIVRIYDKVLSTAEIEENFDAFKGRYGL